MEMPIGFERDFFGIGMSHRTTVERVVAEMRGRLDGTLSLRVMVKIVHLSPYRFARTFRWNRRTAGETRASL